METDHSGPVAFQRTLIGICVNPLEACGENYVAAHDVLDGEITLIARRQLNPQCGA
jgi:hypothetical protein